MMKKKQHYVPKMLLKRFSIPDRKGKCWEYNLYKKEIQEKSIDDVCASNYLYEIRDESGEYFFPEGKNAMENGFSEIEYRLDLFWNEILEKLDSCNEKMPLEQEEVETIYVWIALLILRNPVVLNLLPEVAKEFGVTIDSKMVKSYTFINLMPNLLEGYIKDLKHGHIQFLKAPSDSGFVISDIPVIFKGMPVHEYCYTPISKEYAILITKPDSILVNVNNCVIKELGLSEIDAFNTRMYDALSNAFDSNCLNGGSLLSHDKELLRHILLPGYA